MIYHCYASCSFGIEGILAEELRKMNLQNVTAQDARVYFDADECGIAIANLCLRTADRIYIVLGEFEAHTFEQLFEGVADIRFGDILPSDARFPVNADSVRSDLMSVSDIQAVSKKAVVRSMQRVYPQERFSENGNMFQLYVNLHKNKATVSLNTSGAGLNRRGYRLKNIQAPLKETLAAALILISKWYKRDFYDPMCGSGTIAIEAAMLAMNMAPGLKRRFDAQSHSNTFQKAFASMREKLKNRIKKPEMLIMASDIDRTSLILAKEHAHTMGVAEYIRMECRPAADFRQPKHPATIITNPPYAVRLGEQKEAERLYQDLGKIFLPLHDTVVFILCANERFESLYGAKADKKRKLYNGNLKCTYYQYFKRRNL